MSFKIDSEEYAEYIDNTICGALQDALHSAYDFAMQEFTDVDYYERELRIQKIWNEFEESGLQSEWRDQIVTLFAKYGLDIVPDERDY